MSMSGRIFRNINTTPDTPIDEWPSEVFSALCEYGNREDWRHIARHIAQYPDSVAAHNLRDALCWEFDSYGWFVLANILRQYSPALFVTITPTEGYLATLDCREVSEREWRALESVGYRKGGISCARGMTRNS